MNKFKYYFFRQLIRTLCKSLRYSPRYRINKNAVHLK